ncbi:MAG TPA: RidA family protein [Nevskiaceae bacterium]
MSREAINPKSMYDSVRYGFSHATRSRGGTVIHCSGQVGWDATGKLVGPGDVAAQARQALANLKQVLKEAGATPADVVRMKVFVVNHKPEYLESVGAAIGEFYGSASPPASTWLGVQSLALPELLIEIEATAVVD